MVAEVIKLTSTRLSGFQSSLPQRLAEVTGTSLNRGHTLPASSKSAELIERAGQNAEVVRKAVGNLNNFAEQIQTNLKFSIDEPSGRSVITVTDSQTGEVIRQIPAKEVLAVANLLREFAASDVEKVGLLLAEQG